ncbi:hypothetical protein RINTHH_20440 [Richelia intracellularis HH01]|uniref:Aminoglycoside phosphotransferase domain-containing protein n=1 Tax=Richelia intracellularis HH01 TaxID=1165094 RepID=M1WTM6_9NOST|nr:aminoglycoside phosphotransferase family protein [Richelia intracellularis]CCH68199.1 hypothetical protein RINTHH_20440 [Richelia intracellularis HH01]
MNNLIHIASQFKPNGIITDIQELKCGNINRTFLITLDSFIEKCFILQCINTQVFYKPELIVKNMSVFTSHIFQSLQDFPSTNGRRWEIPKMLLTLDSQAYFIDINNSFWRAITFIERAETFDTIQDYNHAYEVGYALGTFHKLTSDLPIDKLVDTLPGFHIISTYLNQFTDVKLQYNRLTQFPEINYCCKFVNDRYTWAHVLERAIIQGDLRLRTIHGDPKVNNIMIDTLTKKSVSIIDLDTIKPGLIHYDIGDCLRSSCNRLGEETQEWKEVSFDTDICQFVLDGYFSIAKDFLTDNDYEYMYDAIRLITFELGLRFFIDYLGYNTYFKVKYPEQNLVRALVQFQLTKSIELQEDIIRKIIQVMR